MILLEGHGCIEGSNNNRGHMCIALSRVSTPRSCYLLFIFLQSTLLLTMVWYVYLVPYGAEHGDQTITITNRFQQTVPFLSVGSTTAVAVLLSIESKS